MFNKYRDNMFLVYNTTREQLIRNPQAIISTEKYMMAAICNMFIEHYNEFEIDYNEASYLHPFWANYPPDDRGRSPVGDQIPWIEVGEHAIGHKASRLLSQQFEVREIGLPSGADNRFLIIDPKITELTDGITNKALVFLDIKSVGPRDNFDHTVVSPYQVSGDGTWDDPEEFLKNSVLTAKGDRTEHQFYPAIAPLYVLSDSTTAISVQLFVKPIYKMLSMETGGLSGQPLDKITVACLPNGLLLTINPGYLNQYPSLLFPGKDDKNKAPLKVRCRIQFALLRSIAEWRVQSLSSTTNTVA
jgi:hypothetical protein